MTTDHPFDTQRPQRVMVDMPQPGAGVGEALRGTFRVLEDIPCDFARLLDRMRATS